MFALGLLLLYFSSPTLAQMQNLLAQPVIKTEEGHLKIKAARNNHITFHTTGRGKMYLNEMDLTDALLQTKRLAAQIKVLSASSEEESSNVLVSMQNSINTLLSWKFNTTSRNPSGGAASSSISRRMRVIWRRIRRLEWRGSNNECSSNPCLHGGTCIDLYRKYQCLCPKEYEGPRCSIDVNECNVYAGTDKGCQNGATCTNVPGSFSCTCVPGYYGFLCTLQTDSCNQGNSHQLCGHGSCVSRKLPGSNFDYTCICDDGWTNNAPNPVCNVDVNECETDHPHCSRDPSVLCINLPGTFHCGPCPAGYTGNGRYCSDINECLANNGGCYPGVQCVNVGGSRICGPCPAGMAGDGVSCSQQGICQTQNPCSVLATCTYVPAIGVTCPCRPGYTGTGYGPSGCTPDSAVGPPTCSSATCIHGSCIAYGTGSVCICSPGYTGSTCNIAVSQCQNNPCMNQGTCVPMGTSYRCECPAGYTGTNCQDQQVACGGSFTTEEGEISFPANTGIEYNHNTDCVWLLSTTPGKVFNLTFTRFHIEDGYNCQYDYLRFEDGVSPGSPVAGTFCGDTKPGENGVYITTHNYVRLVFHSDHTIAGYGFALTWNITDPVCGGYVRGSQGRIQSPGYPNNYPNNRDCYWTILVPYGKRISILFSDFRLEHHSNCSYDYLKVRDGYDETAHELVTHCSTMDTMPPPLVTSGPYAFLHFHTDGSQTDTGFKLLFHASPGVPGCGGTLTEPTGVIRSPGHPDTHAHNLLCDWHIRVPPEETIKLTFTNFSVEHSTGCVFDYVSVYDGDSPSAPLFGKFCGHSIPSVVLSSGNDLFVQFFADYSVAYPGFRAEYETVCGGTYTSATGFIKSPYFPNYYPNSIDCSYLIHPPAGLAVSISFPIFAVEDHHNCIYDYVEIYDGVDSTFPLLGKYCGGSDQTPPDIVSTRNGLYIKFVTDGSVRNEGFYANYTTISTGCGAIYHNTTGMITSPQHPSQYPNGLDCSWVVIAPPGFLVRLVFLQFHLEQHPNCNYDYVKMFDNSTNPGALIGTYCGASLPEPVTTSDSVLTLHFHSDYTASFGGFSASFVFINASTVCGGVRRGEFGEIKSPGFPNNYPHNRQCVWVISAPAGKQVHVNFTDFNLERHESCHYDYVELRNGGDDAAPVIGQYCGSTAPASFLSHGHELYIKFSSDYSSSHPGFRLEWDASTSGCGGSMRAPLGGFVSPGYPNPYGHGLQCEYEIHVNAGNKIRLVFVDMDVENHHDCQYDYVQVRAARRGGEIKKLCGENLITQPILSLSNSLYITFRSDNSNRGRGFSARYETVCSVTLTGFHGVIESPNFPNLYPHNRNCTWIIKAPKGNKINVTFSHFNIEEHYGSGNCTYDYLSIREGKKDEAPTSIGLYCGSNIPEPIASTKDIMYLSFFSDHTVARNGFRLEWKVNGCGGHFKKNFGYIQSPNYPDRYPRNTECHWYIEVDPGSTIELTIQDYDIESDHGCTYDALYVYGGKDDTYPQLQRLCGKTDRNQVITSHGNHMFIKLDSDSYISGSGFRAHFRARLDGCGGRFKGKSGLIHTRNYPENYNNQDECTWMLQVERGHSVALTFNDFQLESSYNCTYDYVSVTDGWGVDDPELARGCSDDLQAKTFTSSDFRMKVFQRADGSHTAKGFQAAYNTSCGGTILVKEEYNNWGNLLRTPNFPWGTNTPVNCTWILKAQNESSRISLHIVYLKMSNYNYDNCSTHYVEFLDGEDSNAPRIGDRLCDTIPGRIRSTGRTLVVRAYAKYRLAHGLYATYRSSSAGCGGYMANINGRFDNPNYPDPYETDLDCIWRIHLAPGNTARLTFSNFNLESSDGFCNHDYVEVRRDDHYSGELIGRYCSTNPPPNNITSDSGLWIKFRTDQMRQITDTPPIGFSANYALMHGGELTGRWGSVASPIYPLFYFGDEIFEWRITVPEDKVVAIWFSTFYLPDSDFTEGCGNSRIIIHDGYDASAPELKVLCGLKSPGTVKTTGNVAFLRFIPTGFGGDGSRFYAHYWASSSFSYPWHPSNPTNAPAVTIPGCGGTITINSSNPYTLLSPGYPEGYQNNLDCTWILEGPSDRRLRWTLKDVKMQPLWHYCFFDKVAVYDEVAGITSWEGWSRRAISCSPNDVGSTVTSTGNRLKIVMTTDSRSNDTGFNATIETVCGGRIFGESGTITSPNYPSSNYPPNAQCLWRITVLPGRTVKVTVQEITLSGADSGCHHDYLLLRNGGSELSPYLGAGRYCSGASLSSNLETTSHNLYVKFVSDSSSQNRGFKLHWEEVRFACGGTMHLQEGQNIYISSPNYPDAPPMNSECEFVILGPHGRSLAIHFDSANAFGIKNSWRCRKDYILINDGATENSRPLLPKYCGTTSPSTLTTSGNAMYVKYHVTSTEPLTGFKAMINEDICGGYKNGNEGTISSPGFPSGYEGNLNCTWRIRGPEGHYLSMTFLDLDLPSSFSCTSGTTPQIVIYSNVSCSGTPTARICGGSAASAVNTSFHEGCVIFKTSSANHDRKGFRMKFEASVESCGGDYYDESGTFTSPGYPIAYPPYRWCYWKLQVPYGRKIKLQFTEFDLEAGDDTGNGYTSCADGLFVLNGRRTSNMRWSPWLTNATCGSVLPPPVSSSGRDMTVVMYSNHQISGKGFSASYSSDEPADCGGLLQGEGFFTSPNFSSSGNTTYPPNVECEWKYISPHANATVIFSLDTFLVENFTHNNSECHFDALDFYEGELDHRLAEFCGNHTEKLRILFPQPDIRIIFKADHIIQYQGFNASYKVMPCGGVIEIDAEYNISSPNYPNNYQPNTDCVWLIKAKEGERLQIEWIDMDMSGGSSCQNDNLTVVNGQYHNSPEISKSCGTTLPSTVLSSSNYLRVHFHSSSSTSGGRGFMMKVTTQDHDCGGFFHSQWHRIRSPRISGSQRYPNNAECEWQFRYNPGYTSVIGFWGRFDMENSTNCTKDYLQVWSKEEGQVDWKTVGRYCGIQRPSPILTNAYQTKILFTSDGSVNGDGFQSYVYRHCGGNFTEPSGTISSANYPEPYDPNSSCTYFITPKNQQDYAQITFQAPFNIEDGGDSDCYDKLKVYRGATGYWRRRPLVTLCGHTVPQPLVARGGFTLLFTSDAFAQYKGWRLKYITQECGGTIEGPRTIRSPTHPLPYHPNMNCTWVARAPSNKAVQVRMEFLELESHRSCNYDHVAIYDGPSVLSPLITKFCGNYTGKELPHDPKSTGNQLTIEFKTDYIVESGGFEAKVWFTYGQSAGCGGNFTLPINGTKVIQPVRNAATNNYENSQDCTWTVFGDPSQILKYQVASFSSYCPNDFLEIRDGRSMFSDIAIHHCGTSQISSSMVSSNEMWIRFFADGYSNLGGFTLTVTSEPPVCGSRQPINVTDSVQTLSSPGYSSNYGVNLRCQWLLQAPPNKKITLRVTDLDIEDSPNCTKDGLNVQDLQPASGAVVFNGNTASASHNYRWRGGRGVTMIQKHVSHKYCGSVIKEHYIYTRGNAALINFYSDSANTGRGFQLEYHLSSCDNREYSGSSGQLMSPGWPNYFPANSECEFTVTSPVGTMLSLYFFTFNTESSCSNSYLQIRNSSTDSEDSQLGKFCGWSLPHPVFSSTNQLWFHFKGRRSRRGYDITYMASEQALGCGGTLHMNHGALTSPNYPNNQSLGLDCTWDISVPTTTGLLLHFHDVYFMGDSCDTTYLEVLNVDSGATSVAATYCGQETRIAPFTAPNGHIKLHYVTSYNVTGRGWEVTFNARG